MVVLGYEDSGCYVLRLSPDEESRKSVHGQCPDDIKSKLVTVHRSRKIRDMDLLKGNAEDVINQLLATSRETATALIAANR